jgi:hypothetical protein
LQIILVIFEDISNTFFVNLLAWSKFFDKIIINGTNIYYAGTVNIQNRKALKWLAEARLRFIRSERNGFMNYVINMTEKAPLE